MESEQQFEARPDKRAVCIKDLLERKMNFITDREELIACDEIFKLK